MWFGAYGRRLIDRAEPDMAIFERRAGTGVLYERPGIGRKYDLAGKCLLLGPAALDEWIARDQELPAPAHAADAQDHDLASPDAHFRQKPNTLCHGVLGRRGLQRQCEQCAARSAALASGSSDAGQSARSESPAIFRTSPP